MSVFKFFIDHNSAIPKYRQIINQVEDAAGAGILSPGDNLPSVNQMIRELNLSRDTVFKAYEQLKIRGLIESIPSKGYFIRKVKTRVLLFLDKYSPFKEGLYNAMRNDLPESYSIDLYFHHYNLEVFKNVLYSGIGRYNYFVIMSFDNAGISSILASMDKSRILILDVCMGTSDVLPRICQDFGSSFYNCLVKVYNRLLEYTETLFVLRPETHHPDESAMSFINFCSDHGIRGKVLGELRDEDIRKDRAYIVVSDDDMVMIVEKAVRFSLEFGKNIGLISYNDTSVKKVIAGGVTVISTDFIEMGRKVAEYLKNPEPVRIIIPTRLINRKSL